MRFLQQFLIKIYNNKIGNDEFGNSYFESKNGKRFVVYKGMAEPSKVPAEWHGWLHYSTDLAPINLNTKKYSWQKIHLPNLTGTKNAYSPKNTHTKPHKPYSAWKPN